MRENGAHPLSHQVLKMLSAKTVYSNRSWYRTRQEHKNAFVRRESFQMFLRLRCTTSQVEERPTIFVVGSFMCQNFTCHLVLLAHFHNYIVFKCMSTPSREIWTLSTLSTSAENVKCHKFSRYAVLILTKSTPKFFRLRRQPCDGSLRLIRCTTSQVMKNVQCCSLCLLAEWSWCIVVVFTVSSLYCKTMRHHPMSH